MRRGESAGSDTESYGSDNQRWDDDDYTVLLPPPPPTRPRSPRRIAAEPRPRQQQPPSPPWQQPQRSQRQQQQHRPAHRSVPRVQRHHRASPASSRPRSPTSVNSRPLLTPQSEGEGRRQRHHREEDSEKLALLPTPTSVRRVTFDQHALESDGARQREQRREEHDPVLLPAAAPATVAALGRSPWPVGTGTGYLPWQLPADGAAVQPSPRHPPEQQQQQQQAGSIPAPPTFRALLKRHHSRGFGMTFEQDGTVSGFSSSRSRAKAAGVKVGMQIVEVNRVALSGRGE
jgi:hypothetical protein